MLQLAATDYVLSECQQCAETVVAGRAQPEVLQLSGCWRGFVRNRKGIDTNSRYNRLPKR